MSRGIILYGPPGAGKDTITEALHRADPAYIHYQKLKVGAGRTRGYRVATAEKLKELAERDAVVWSNERYGATYVIERASLIALLVDRVPVVHVGQLPAIKAIADATPDVRWTVVYLWCPREEASRRIRDRQDADLDARLRAWDETDQLADGDVTLDTSTITVEEAARRIHEAVTAGHDHLR